MRREQLEYAASRYGTPLYIFDLDLLKKQADRIKTALGQSLSDRSDGRLYRPDRSMLHGRIPDL